MYIANGSSTGKMYFFVGGTGTSTSANNKMTITTTGTGFGSTTPSATVAIQGTSTINPFAVASSTGSTLFSVLANGNVGIGTNAPTSQLMLSSSNVAMVLRDTGQVDPAGTYTIQDAVDAYKIYRGTLGVSAGEKFRISNTNTYVGSLDVRTTSGGDFSGGRSVSSFPVSGVSYINTGSGLAIGSTTAAGMFFIQGTTTLGTLTIASSTGVNTFVIGRSGLMTNGGETPTIATSTGDGTTGGTATLTGGQNAGTIRLNTGTAPGTSATIVTITLKESCPNAPVPVIYPGDATTATLSGTSMVNATGTSATTWTLNSNTVALVGATTYQWNYIVSCR
jgi:hypothetical protein